MNWAQKSKISSNFYMYFVSHQFLQLRNTFKIPIIKVNCNNNYQFIKDLSILSSVQQKLMIIGPKTLERNEI